MATKPQQAGSGKTASKFKLLDPTNIVLTLTVVIAIFFLVQFNDEAK